MSFSTLIKPSKDSFSMYCPTQIVFGKGVMKTMRNYAMPGKKALLITDKDPFCIKLGYVAAIEEEMKAVGVSTVLFNKVQPNPTEATVAEGVELCKNEGIDMLIALGGGSVIDTAKAIAIVVANGGELWDYIYGGSGKAMPIAKHPLPIIAIPTTAGTGSEVGAGLVITKEETNEKACVKAPTLFPVYCFSDSEVQKSVPPMLTAFQGFDAISHCMEGFLNNRGSLMSDMYCLTAIEKVAKYLPIAVKDGSNLEAREGVGFGAILSGVVMAIDGTSSMHAIEQSLSAYHDKLPHGAGLIMLARAYWEHIAQAGTRDERLVMMAKAMGKEDADCAQDFLDALDQFINAIGCGDLKMSDYGVTPDEFDMIDENSRYVMGACYDPGYDSVIFNHDDVIEVLNKSYK